MNFYSKHAKFTRSPAKRHFCGCSTRRFKIAAKLNISPCTHNTTEPTNHSRRSIGRDHHRPHASHVTSTRVKLTHTPKPRALSVHGRPSVALTHTHTQRARPSIFARRGARRSFIQFCTVSVSSKSHLLSSRLSSRRVAGSNSRHSLTQHTPSQQPGTAPPPAKLCQNGSRRGKPRLLALLRRHGSGRCHHLQR